MRIPHSTCIDQILTSSHIHYSDEPNAIIFIQVLALSHRAQVLILSQIALRRMRACNAKRLFYLYESLLLCEP